jgi:poly-beta-1,6-N-acetyl-D-glucosamine N-deacetylase
MNLAKLIKYKNFFFGFAIGLITFIAISILILYITAPKIPLLGFHGIIDLEKPDQVFVQGTAFQEMAYNKQDLEPVLDYLLQNNYWFLSTQELHDYFLTKSQPLPSEKIGKKPIMLSFDDGYKTDYVNLLPLLESLEKKYNQKVKVVLFINPGTLATKESIASTKLSCPQIMIFNPTA